MNASINEKCPSDSEGRLAQGRMARSAGLRVFFREYLPEASARANLPPVLLLHGWPTSGYLWRNVAPLIAARSGRRALSLDLPGFGQSDKPFERLYSFSFYTKVLNEFLKSPEVGLGPDETIALAVHDLGGPVGLYWAGANRKRVERLALLNTLVYPEMSWAVKAFVLSLRLPLIRDWICSPAGLRWTMRFGVANKRALSAEAILAVQSPFIGADERVVLRKTGTGLGIKGFFVLSERLKQFTGPVCMVYGARDRILPDIAETARRLASDLPQAQITALPDCGHFLQEDRPDEVGRLLGQFFA